jgi:hypothetical protein
VVVAQAIQMDQAQRRMLEIQTGLRSPSRPRRWNIGTLDGVRGTAARRGATESRRAYEGAAWDEFTC